MKKKILVSVLIALMLGIVQPIGTVVRGYDDISSGLDSEQDFEPDNEEDNNKYFSDVVKIDSVGQITLISDHANENQVNTLELSLNLKVRDDVEVQINSASFEFSANLCEDTYVKTAQYRYDEDLNRLTLYLSDTETLFDDAGFLYLGYVKVEDIPIEKIEISVVENSLMYVYQNVITPFEFATEIETATEATTTTTTETTTTTTEETTTEEIQQHLDTVATGTSTTTTEPETTKATTTTESETTKATTTTESETTKA
ncbi:MAG: hypothetical protein K2H89_06770, partial [Oscillospiraceae bacterium]|nr:hypothetical protein [Oscillospiraceae bacterium]